MTVHEFKPTVYHVTIGSHAPVLHIADGDTVETTTIDAAGMDSHGVQLAPRGNPQTGPFYVESAQPGDVLAVTLDVIRPNRATGWTRSVVAANVVDPSFVPVLPHDDVVAVWAIDTAAGTATISSPDTVLGAFSIPLDPMIGCFGVAPPRGQAISCATSAQHGGNMDYRGFRAGVTIYFPVFVDGALFHIGDGHAVQGDGEIVGTGIETSMDVRFTVRIVRRGNPIEWPRADDGTFLITVGNARPLDQALQHATTEMLRWLQEEYALDTRAASLLLGQCVRYEIGNVFDPAYTVVCQIEKRLLPDPSHPR